MDTAGCFNPCFNGSMYKNVVFGFACILYIPVSILVLMDLCIKTNNFNPDVSNWNGFNPCFNGSMYKNWMDYFHAHRYRSGFNPCFNGSMYKNMDAILNAWANRQFQSLF